MRRYSMIWWMVIWVRTCWILRILYKINWLKTRIHRIILGSRGSVLTFKLRYPRIKRAFIISTVLDTVTGFTKNDSFGDSKFKKITRRRINMDYRCIPIYFFILIEVLDGHCQALKQISRCFDISWEGFYGGKEGK